MSAARPRRAAAGAAAVCALLAVAACTSSSTAAEHAEHAAHAAHGEHGKGPKAAQDTTAAQDADAATLGTLTLTATKNTAVLHPLVALAPRDFDSSAADTDGVHTARIRQEEWSGPLRVRTISAVADWSGKGRVEMLLDDTGDDDGLQNLRLRILGDTVYGRQGEKPEDGAGGRHWVQVEGAIAGAYGQLGAGDLNPLKQARNVLLLPTTKPVGKGTFRGVKATHYRSTIDAASLDTAARGDFGSAAAERLKEALDSAGLTSETIDLWMSDGHLPLEMTVEDDGPDGPDTLITDYLDYGLAVDVAAPPAFDTVSSKELDDADE